MKLIKILVVHTCQKMFKVRISHKNYIHWLMKSMTIFIFIIAIEQFRNINVLYCFCNTLPSTVCNLNLSHIVKAEGGIASVKQEHKEVKWCCLLWNDLSFTLCDTFSALHFVFYACPQLMNDVNYKSSGNNSFANADVKEECSSHFSNYSNNEGNTALYLCLVLYYVH